ncbi:MAG TPA: RICIN domain-containing protein, partial [Kofleriaceae bacterium]|nr:RICIN domain-containing protein [Kofleriaceae bacterium]
FPMRSRVHRAQAMACVTALSLSVSLAGCLAEEELDAEDESAEIVGQPATLGPNLVQMTHRVGSFRWFSAGFVLAPDLVVGHLDTLATGHDFLWRSGTGQQVSGIVHHDNDSQAYFPGIAMYEIDALPTAGAGINTEAPAAINGRAASCFAFRRLANGTYQAQTVLVTISNPTSDEIPVVSVSNLYYLEAGDLGAPCVSTVDGKLYGVVKSVSPATRRAVLVRAASSGFQYWIEGIKNLILVRNHGLTEGPFTIDYQPQAGNAQRMCLDVPSASPFNRAPIQQYPCHGKDNQRWYIDHRASDPAHPRLVSASSGRCIDVPNASSAPGERFQQSLCHDGLNQKFIESWVGNGLYMLQPRSAPNLCLSVVGGPSLAAQPTEQRACWNDPLSRDQRWRFGP